MHQSKRPAAIIVAARPYFEGEGINLDDPKVQEAIQAAVAEASQRFESETAGLRANRDEILEEKRKLKEQMDGLTTQWAGLDAEKVRGILKRFENDEEAQLIADGKVDEVIERRVGAMRTDLEGQLAQATERLTEHETAAQRMTGRVKTLLLERDLIQAAAKQGIRAEAMPDVIARAGGIFVLDASGEELEAREGDVLLKGKDGKSKLLPSEWLEGRKKDCPHWWPGSQGAGSSGGDGRAGEISKDKLDGMSAREKLKLGMGGA